MKIIENIPSYSTTLNTFTCLWAVGHIRLYEQDIWLQKWEKVVCRDKQWRTSSCQSHAKCMNCGEQFISSALPHKGLHDDIKVRLLGAPGWLSWLSAWLLISAQVIIPGSWDRALSQAPSWAWSLLKILSFSLNRSFPMHARSLLEIKLKIKKELFL